MSLKPIVLYSHGPTRKLFCRAAPASSTLLTRVSDAANPIKVAIILEELGIPYEAKGMNNTNIKEEPYISINPSK